MILKKEYAASERIKSSSYQLRQFKLKEIKRQRSHKLKYIWENMKSRCNNKIHYKYRLYGALGVTVCKEWLNNYYVFYDWCLSNGYEEGLQLDKDILCDKLNISPKIYSPTTCLWVTPQQNIAAKYNK